MKIATQQEVISALDEKMNFLWDDYDDSSDKIWSDRIRLSQLINDQNGLNKRSLRLIAVRNLIVQFSSVNDYKTGKPKLDIRGVFSYFVEGYRLKITDVLVEEIIKPMCEKNGDGEFEIKDALLCISLGEPLENSAWPEKMVFKLVASVIRVVLKNEEDEHPYSGITKIELPEDSEFWKPNK